MKITIKIEGNIVGRERIETELDVPENWKPTFETFCKTKGAVRFLTEKLAQEFEPKPSTN